MKKLFFLIITVLFSSFHLFSQDEIDIVDPYEMKVSRSKQADTFYFTQKAIPTAIDPKKKLDTLRTYDVFLEERQTPFGTAYICNGNEVTKKKYLEYKYFWDAAGACKPCLLYTYDDKDQLKYIAYQYLDCLCGSYEEYYSDGQLKVQGQFKKVATENFDNLHARDVCNLRNGTWTYYLPNGVTEKIETYIDGKLKDTSMSTTTVAPNNKTTSANNNDTDEETTSKKGFIKKLKEKIKKQED
jgi:hypothetical protein